MTTTAIADPDIQVGPDRLAGRELEELVRTHLPLVGQLVREMLRRVPAHIHRDDLVSAGMAALAGAATSFDPSRGVPFAGFAATRIRGALLDELRSMDWASRSVRSRARRIDDAEQRLSAQLGRAPTRAELAEALGVAAHELTTLDEEVQRAAVLSLHGLAPGATDDLVPDRSLGPEDLLLHRERVGYLHNAVEALPERLRAVVSGYFLHGRTMVDLASELGVTQSRVSQLRAEALDLLREGLNTHLDPDLVAASDKPDGCAARRRESYYHRIASNNTLESRLAHTNHHGMPFAQAARPN
jgi:RNA polymerase sigma factor for flagellar operon FliA